MQTLVVGHGDGTGLIWLAGMHNVAVKQLALGYKLIGHGEGGQNKHRPIGVGVDDVAPLDGHAGFAESGAGPNGSLAEAQRPRREISLEVKEIGVQPVWQVRGIDAAGLNPYAFGLDRKSTRLNSSHSQQSRMPSSA